MRTLSAGWNLVGWSGASGAREAFDFISGPFEVAFTYDPGTQSFASFNPRVPEVLNTLEAVAFGDGLWVFSEAPTTWVQPAPWWARDVALRRGFNLTLWTGPSDTPMDEATVSLGTALNAAFIWDAETQAFLSFTPGRPDFLNSAQTIDYGDGVWIDVARDATWSQPALPRVGAQDIWFVHRISRLDAEGNRLEDLTNAVLGLAGDDLDPPVPLRFGLVFQESRGLTARLLADNAAQIPNLEVTVGLLSRALTAAQEVDAPADIFLGESFAGIVLISSARLDQAAFNVDLTDVFALDFTEVTQIEVGDVLSIEYVFAQALEREFPLEYAGLSVAQVFTDRWNRGDLQILGQAQDDGSTQVIRQEAIAGVAEGSKKARALAKEAVIRALADRIRVDLAGGLPFAFEAVGLRQLSPFATLNDRQMLGLVGVFTEADERKLAAEKSGSRPPSRYSRI